jgi:hypothetical protein
MLASRLKVVADNILEWVAAELRWGGETGAGIGGDPASETAPRSLYGAAVLALWEDKAHTCAAPVGGEASLPAHDESLNSVLDL